MDVDLEYPKGFPVEYKPQLEAALAKAEHTFLTATRGLPVNCFTEWGLHACHMIQTVFSAHVYIDLQISVEDPFFEGYACRMGDGEALIRKISEGAFSRLPATDHGESMHFRRESFIKVVDDYVKCSDAWWSHRKARMGPMDCGTMWRMVEQERRRKGEYLPDPRSCITVNDNEVYLELPYDPAAWKTPELRRRGVETYIYDAKAATGRDITRENIWQAAKYKTARSFENWQDCDSKTSKQCEKIFRRFFKNITHLSSRRSVGWSEAVRRSGGWSEGGLVQHHHGEAPSIRKIISYFESIT